MNGNSPWLKIIIPHSIWGARWHTMKPGGGEWAHGAIKEGAKIKSILYNTTQRPEGTGRKKEIASAFYAIFVYIPAPTPLCCFVLSPCQFPESPWLYTFWHQPRREAFDTTLMLRSRNERVLHTTWQRFNIQCQLTFFSLFPRSHLLVSPPTPFLSRSTRRGLPVPAPGPFVFMTRTGAH